jgi:phospholipid/cholesterol/gamma-HCH transport system substrate-binding protein
MTANKESFKIKVGLFVLIGLFLFVLAIFIIGKQKSLFDPVFKITTTFYNVSGLQVGNNVRFSGINVGTVDKIIIINDSTVRVDMYIKKDVQKFIKTDSEVGIGSEGIIGDRLLIITQGSTEASVIKHGQELYSSEPVETDAIIASLEVTALNAEILSAELANFMTGINSGKGTFGRLFKDTTMAENLSKTMSNLETSSQALEENMNAAKESILLRGYFKRKKQERNRK